ncbi:MAG TPA: TonB-dependent receptor plug domain-containing protein, partial [Prolixibacteraceae bacterium]|nr:TonB-dependent receptor plug domain-containing protein [Prolixibacteraceae bacterium]
MKLDLFKRELSLILRKSGVVRYVVLFAVLGLSVTPSGFANDKTRNSKHPEQQDNVQVSPSAVQQAPTKRVTGKIVDEHDAPIAGATIVVVGTTRGVISDNDGTFNIDVRPQEMLKFSFVGYNDQILEVGDRATIIVKMALKTEELEDVTVVAFAKQKKESVLASIETVRPSDLRVPSSNLTTALGGKLAGVISYQRSGEPGQDNAEFFIRGVTTFGYARDPLILIDGIELSKNDLARLHPDDIASFSIMKDATATALYGARGANGVILVTTKGGKEGKTTVSVRFESSLSEPTS